MPRLIGSLLVAFMLSRSSLGAPKLLNALAAKVGNQVVSVQDAYIFRSFQRLRTGQKPFVMAEEGNALQETIKKVILQKMILLEAQAVEFKDPSPQEASQLIRNWKQKGYGDEWGKLLLYFSLTETEAQTGLQQELYAEKFLKRKIEALTQLVTEADIDAYIKAYPAKIKKLSGDTRRLVADALRKEKTDKGLQDWIDFLMDKYSVTYLIF